MNEELDPVSEPVEDPVAEEPKALSLTKEQLDALLLKLLETSKETLRMALEALKSDGKEAVDKGKEFAKAAQDLTIDLVGKKVTLDEYKDAMENLALAMDAYLVIQGYEKSRKYLTIAVGMLKNILSTVITVLI